MSVPKIPVTAAPIFRASGPYIGVESTENSIYGIYLSLGYGQLYLVCLWTIATIAMEIGTSERL